MTARLLAPALLIAAAVAVVGVVATRGGGYIVRAEFQDAAGLRPNFYVKIGGVPVGKVTSVRLSRHDTAIATLEIDHGAGAVGRNAGATIRPSNLLGEKYIELRPGDPADPAPSGTLIPRARTATPSELDDLIDTFDPQTRLALGIFLSEQGKALAGRGADLAATLGAMPRALDSTRQLIADLGRDNRALGDLVERSDRIVAATAAKRRPLGRLVASASGTFETLAARQAALGATVRSAPGAVAQVRTSLLNLQRSAIPLAGAARGLRASAPPMTATLRALPSFVAAARPAMRTIRATAPALDQLGRRATPVVRRLHPAARQLDRFATSLDPVTSTLDTGIGDALGLMEGWARAIQNRDAAGHVYRVGLLLGDAVIRALMKDFVAPPAVARHRGAGKKPAAAPPAPRLPAPLTRLPKPQLPDLHLPGVPVSPLQPPDVQRAVPRLPDVHLPAAKADLGDRSLATFLDYLLRP